MKTKDIIVGTEYAVGRSGSRRARVTETAVPERVGYGRDTRNTGVRVTYLDNETGADTLYGENYYREELRGKPQTSLLSSRDVKMLWTERAAQNAALKASADRRRAAYQAEIDESREALQAALDLTGVTVAESEYHWVNRMMTGDKFNVPTSGDISARHLADMLTEAYSAGMIRGRSEASA